MRRTVFNRCCQACIFVGLILCGLQLRAAKTPSIAWSLMLSNEVDDLGRHYAPSLVTAKADPEGNLFVCGHIGGADYPNSLAIAVMLDAQGKEQWRYKSSFESVAGVEACDIGPDGSLVIAAAGLLQELPLPKLHVIKLLKAGQVLWEYSPHMAHNPKPEVRIDSSGATYVYFTSISHDEGSDSYTFSATVTKIGPAGNIVFSVDLPLDVSEAGTFQLLRSGEVILSGWRFDNERAISGIARISDKGAWSWIWDPGAASASELLVQSLTANGKGQILVHDYGSTRLLSEDGEQLGAPANLAGNVLGTTERGDFVMGYQSVMWQIDRNTGKLNWISRERMQDVSTGTDGELWIREGISNGNYDRFHKLVAIDDQGRQRWTVPLTNTPDLDHGKHLILPGAKKSFYIVGAPARYGWWFTPGDVVVIKVQE